MMELLKRCSCLVLVPISGFLYLIIWSGGAIVNWVITGEDIEKYHDKVDRKFKLAWKWYLQKK